MIRVFIIAATPMMRAGLRTLLNAAVQAVAHGFAVLPPALTTSALGPLATDNAIAAEPLEEPLTGRELEVLELVSQGLSNKMIARRLQISEHTVKFHVLAVYAK